MLENLSEKRRRLRTKPDQKSKDELKQVDNELTEKYSENMYSKIMEELKGVNDSEEGGFNSDHVWKLKKRILPRLNDVPRAMLSSEAFFTNQDDILGKAVTRIFCY